jgi:cytochrome c oxidase accessory protein FixG
VLCPYGRLQSLLHDRDSVTVFYDELRGEPRGKLQKKQVEGVAKTGDCVDCHRCVTACPTGIDIRDGLQMECVACLQCVDACDEVMKKVDRAPNLIGLFSENQQKGRPTHVARPRLFVYGGAMVVMLLTLVVSLVVRTPFEANLTRPRGANPYTLDGQVVRNAFEVHLVNKHPEPAAFTIAVTAPVPATIFVGTPTVLVPSLGDTRVPVSVTIDRSQLATPVELTVEIRDVRNGEVKRQPFRFLAPLGAAP